MRIRSPYGWAILAGALALADGLTWALWREQWYNGLHDIILAAMALAGFKMFYKLGREDRRHEQRTIRPNGQYFIYGPDQTYVVTGLSIWQDGDEKHAEVSFLDPATWARRRG